MKHSGIGYKRHRFPPSVVAHAVWLYFRFPLSLRRICVMRWLWGDASSAFIFPTTVFTTLTVVFG
jgi:hypothetical protein